MGDTPVAGDWTDDYEELQTILGGDPGIDASGFMPSIFEMPFAAMPGSRMYQSWTLRDGVEPEPVLSNWHAEDLAAYCGGEYAKASYNSN